jgi:hypothetical protein
MRAKWLKPLGLRFESFLRLDREADDNLGRTIEYLDDLIAKQTAELASHALAGGQFNAAIAGIAAGTCDVGLLHLANMPHGQTAFQPAPNTKYLAGKKAR